MNPFENERKEIDEYSQDELERIYGVQPEYDEDDWYDAFEDSDDLDDPELLDAPEDLDPPDDFDGYWADLDEPQVDETDEIPEDAPTPDDFEDENVEWPEWKEEEEEVVEESKPLTEEVLTEGPFKAIGAKLFDGKLKKLFKKYQVVLGNNTPKEFNTFADADKSAKADRVAAAMSSDATDKTADAFVYGVLADNFAGNANIKKFLGATDDNKVLLVKRSGDDGEAGIDYAKQVLEKLKKWQEAEKAAKNQAVSEDITKVIAAIEKLPKPEKISRDAGELEKLKEPVQKVQDAFKALGPDKQAQIDAALKDKLTAVAQKVLGSTEEGEEKPPVSDSENPPTDDKPKRDMSSLNIAKVLKNTFKDVYTNLSKEDKQKLVKAILAAAGNGGAK